MATAWLMTMAGSTGARPNAVGAGSTNPRCPNSSIAASTRSSSIPARWHSAPRPRSGHRKSTCHTRSASADTPNAPSDALPPSVTWGLSRRWQLPVMAAFGSSYPLSAERSVGASCDAPSRRRLAPGGIGLAAGNGAEMRNPRGHPTTNALDRFSGSAGRRGHARAAGFTRARNRNERPMTRRWLRFLVSSALCLGFAFAPLAMGPATVASAQTVCTPEWLNEGTFVTGKSSPAYEYDRYDTYSLWLRVHTTSGTMWRYQNSNCTTG